METYTHRCRTRSRIRFISTYCSSKPAWREVSKKQMLVLAEITWTGVTRFVGSFPRTYASVENALAEQPFFVPPCSPSDMSNNERAAFQAEVAAVEEWFRSARFARVRRPYTAAQVVAKRGTIPIKYPSDILGKKLFALLSQHARNGTPSHTYGA